MFLFLSTKPDTIETMKTGQRPQRTKRRLFGLVPCGPGQCHGGCGEADLPAPPEGPALSSSELPRTGDRGVRLLLGLEGPRKEKGTGLRQLGWGEGGSMSLLALGNFYSVAASECFGQQLRMKLVCSDPTEDLSLSTTSPITEEVLSPWTSGHRSET